jgi:hypothetical protein
LRSLSGDLSSPIGWHARRASFPASAPEFRRRRFYRIRQFLGFFAGRDPHDFHRCADHVGGALLAAGTSGHIYCLAPAG